MPYEKTSDLPKQVKSLPLKAKKIFLKVFNKAIKEYTEKESFRIAWRAVKEKYKKKDSKWVLKREISIKTNFTREGMFWNSSYYFDIVLSGNNRHYDGYRVSKKLLREAITNKMINEEGDIHHLNASGNSEYKGLFKKVKEYYKDGKIYLRIAINKLHDKYKEFIKKAKNKDYFHLSAEFLNPQIYNKLIYNADAIDWTITPTPADFDSNLASVIKAN
ncbi:MAG: ChaB family protein [Thermotogota bacterium]